VSQNWQGGRTPYGDPYHGYWIQDHSQLNEHFGTADDLKALSDEVHHRGMLLMVDVVANNVMAESTTPDYSKYMFKDAVSASACLEVAKLTGRAQSQYHPYCPVEYGNRTSEMNCWLGDTNVTLPDLNTQNPTVMSTYQSWIHELVQTYNIDGLRIDGTLLVFPRATRALTSDATSREARRQLILDAVLRRRRRVLHGRGLRRRRRVRLRL
jgi:alpha-amylase